MLVAAGFVVWAVASSGSGANKTATVRLGGAPPPPAQASPIAVQLANAVGRANIGSRFRRVDMTRVAPFAWDRVLVFQDESSADINRRLGFDWGGAPASVPRGAEREALLAFVHGRQVAGSAFFSAAIGHLDCLTAPRGYTRGTPFVVRFTRQHDAYLATLKPDAAEAACLRAVGAR